MVHPVLKYPNEELRTEALPVKDFSSQRYARLIEEMITTMRRLNGIGLAATQIGIHEQIAVIEMKDGPLVLMNPIIEKPSKKLATDEEGCLSAPGIFGFVRRSQKLRLRAFTLEGKEYHVDAKGLFARVIQHEVDHLQGHLFLDRCHALTSGIREARRLGLSIPSVHEDL